MVSVMNRASSRIFSLGFLLAFVAAGLFSAWAGAASRPPAPEVAQTSYTLRLMGYEQTITIRTSPAELSAFLNDPANASSLFSSALDTQSGQAIPPDQPPPGLGGCLPAPVKLLGMEIPGWLILVRVQEHQLLWIVWDNPYLFQVQRWQSWPVEEGTRLTLKIDSEIPQQGWLGWAVRIFNFESLSRQVFKGVDLMLARIQDHFDPSLKAEDLVAVGLRGDYYEAFMQAHEVQTVIPAGVAEVEAWIRNPEHQSLALLQPGNECLYQPVGPEAALYCSVVPGFGNGLITLDTFSREMKTKKQYTRRVYFTDQEQVGFLELDARSEGKGTRLLIRYATEIPNATSDQNMDQLLFLAGLPPLLEAQALQIKRGVEQFKPDPE